MSTVNVSLSSMLAGKDTLGAGGKRTTAAENVLVITYAQQKQCFCLMYCELAAGRSRFVVAYVRGQPATCLSKSFCQSTGPV